MRSSSRLAICLLLLALCLMAFPSLTPDAPLQAQSQTQSQAKPLPTPTLTRFQIMRNAFYQSWIGDHPVVQSYTSAGASGADSAQSLPLDSGVHWAWDCVFSVIQHHIDGNWELFTFRNLEQPNLDLPTDWHRVTYHQAADVHPRLNPQVTRIAFASNRDGNFEIYTVGLDGSNLRRLTYSGGNDSIPVWSPDGSKIAFVSDRDGNPEVYVMNADGSGQTRLTHDPAFDVEPTWSPDGSRLAWVRHTGGYGVIWAMQADGSSAQPLTNELHFPQHLDWSPDGSKIAFDFDQDGDWLTELALVYASGGDPWGVGPTSRHMEERWCNGWSTDSTGIMFTLLTYRTYDEQFVVEGTFYGGQTVIEIPGQPYLGGVTRLSPALYGHTRRNDYAPPTSSVRRLPAYVRAGSCLVSWSGWDEVQGTVASYDLQYRIGATGDWMDWMVDTDATSANFMGWPGSTVYFRSRAEDRCEQVEDWPSGDGDAWTTLYAWKLAGQVTDQRGVPLTNLPVSIHPAPMNPVRTGYEGRFTALTSAKGLHAVQASVPGYAATHPSTFQMLTDRSVTLRLGPEDNLFANGDFEAPSTGPTGWSVAGSLPVALTEGYTGGQAVALGEDCPAPCLMEPTSLWATTDNWVNMVADEDGSLHMVWLGREGGNGRLYYSRRSPAGVWQEPSTVSHGAIWWDHPALAIDAEGTLHVVWGYDWNEVTYLQKPRDGKWSAPERLGLGERPSLGVDSTGRVHLTYLGVPAGITYLIRETDGVWSKGTSLGSSTGNSALVIGPDDTVHVLLMRGAETGQLEICYTMCPPGGEWTKPRLLSSNPATEPGGMRMTLGPDGRLHAFWIESGTVYYATRDMAGQWSATQRMRQGIGAADMVVDAAGVVHLVCAGTGGAITYQWGSSAGVWSDPMSVIERGRTALGRWPDLCLDQGNRLHLAWHAEIPIAGSTLRYTNARCATQAGAAALAQSVTIPADMHQPTLAFSYSLRSAGDPAQSPLTIEVSDEMSTTQVYPVGGYALMEWADAWVDMAPWAGQTVTVTFSLRQGADEPLARLVLDDVSLGSWKTPVVQRAKLEPGSGTAGFLTLTITGDNFLPGATVHVGETPVDHVEWVDAQTLRGTLPLDLPPGIHPVWVTNPAGQHACYLAGVALGNQLELPALYKWHVPH